MKAIIRRTIKDVRAGVRRRLYAGNEKQCPVCGFNARRFLPFGIVPRPQAQCPSCNSLERHRFVWLFLQSRSLLSPALDKPLLHVAPEACLEAHFRRSFGSAYLTADLFKPADVHMDITAIQYPDESFGQIYCSHVLEHVLDDRKAIREMYRVLTPGGWAILNVPITAPVTDEDPTVTDPAERLRLYGQEDHVRRYGPDYIDRLTEVGFHVEEFIAGALLTKTELDRYAIPGDERLIFCTKEA